MEETEPYVRIWTAEELIEMERSNIQYRLAQQYEIQQYEYEGDIPQDIRELSDEEGSMDRPNAYGCLCAMEEFCAGQIIQFWRQNVQAFLETGWCCLRKTIGSMCAR